MSAPEGNADITKASASGFMSTRPSGRDRRTSARQPHPGAWRLRNRAAIPALAVVIDDEDADGDTRWTAVESLGRVVRRRFLDKPDPVAAARAWIAERKRKAK
jgi:hypothetical protein